MNFEKLKNDLDFSQRILGRDEAGQFSPNKKRINYFEMDKSPMT
mgnify:CR=1 FL=1